LFVLPFLIINSCLFARYKTIDIVLAAYSKRKLKCFLGHPETILDIVSYSDSSQYKQVHVHAHLLVIASILCLSIYTFFTKLPELNLKTHADTNRHGGKLYDCSHGVLCKSIFGDHPPYGVFLEKSNKIFKV
jgi:hypothetical protein